MHGGWCRRCRRRCLRCGAPPPRQAAVSSCCSVPPLTCGARCGRKNQRLSLWSWERTHAPPPPPTPPPLLPLGSSQGHWCLPGGISECGLCLVLIDPSECPSDPDNLAACRTQNLAPLSPGQLCEGSGACGTDRLADQCNPGGFDVYRVEFVVSPPSPPPPWGPPPSLPPSLPPSPPTPPPWSPPPRPPPSSPTPSTRSALACS
mmetsp:Transcript_38631/g.121295  ORF Transcript_38631/g.121295 Transcript_38631/m.121295 type:complete len:204 (+) Transcript_38631:425-1036(+)